MSRKKSAGRVPRASPVADSGANEAKSPFAPRGTASPMLWWARGALSVAVVVAFYLTYASLAGGGVIGCGAEDACGEVLNSRWSKWLGIPVTLPAAALYLGLIGLSLLIGKSTGDASGRLPRVLIRAGAWTVLGAAAWFLVLSAFVLRKFCPYCLTVHLCGSAGAFLILKHLQIARKQTGPAESFISQAPWAVAALGLLIAGQVLFMPASYRVASVPVAVLPPAADSAPFPVGNAGTKSPPASPISTSASAPLSVPVSVPEPPDAVAPPEAGELLSVRSRVMTLYGGQFQLDLYQLPLIGSPAAPKVMISQFDYTCKHCRESHEPITAAQRVFSNELAVVCLPMPLDGHCNEWMRRTSPAHTNACQLSALALALWRADRTKFREFDDWMMTSPEALQVPVALARARSLVGKTALDEAFGDPWVLNTLQLSVNLYRSNWLAAKSSAMPMLMAGTNVVTGTVPSISQLFRLLEHALGLKASL